MAIDVTLGEAKTQKEKPFPKLMKCTGNSWAKGAIVYFLSTGIGIQLSQAIEGDKSFPSPPYSGYAENWLMADFTDYNEPITIQNA